MVQISDDPDRMLWSLWAAKEAAFKAFSRDSSMIFAPIQFQVFPSNGDDPAFVSHGTRSIDVRWVQRKDWVHAVAGIDLSVLVAAVAVNQTQDESTEVRALACSELARAGYPAGTLEGVPPVYRYDGGEAEVSLSHDGPYSAVVFLRRI